MHAALNTAGCPLSTESNEASWTSEYRRNQKLAVVVLNQSALSLLLLFPVLAVLARQLRPPRAETDALIRESTAPNQSTLSLLLSVLLGPRPPQVCVVLCRVGRVQCAICYSPCGSLGVTACDVAKSVKSRDTSLNESSMHCFSYHSDIKRNFKINWQCIQIKHSEAELGIAKGG